MKGILLENENVEEQGRMMLDARIREVPPIFAGKLTLRLRWQGYRGKSDPFFVILRNYEHEGDKDFANKCGETRKTVEG